jgi:hypothetical protein
MDIHAVAAQPSLHDPMVLPLTSALALLRRERHGFDAASVKFVEAVASVVDLDCLAVEFVLVLRDFRRFHLSYVRDYRLDEDDDDAPVTEKLHLEQLPTGRTILIRQGADWSNDVEALNGALAAFQRS